MHPKLPLLSSLEPKVLSAQHPEMFLANCSPCSKNGLQFARTVNFVFLLFLQKYLSSDNRHRHPLGVTGGLCARGTEQSGRSLSTWSTTASNLAFNT